MKLSWNWLKDYVAINESPSNVAERLTMTGLEVKSVQKIGNDYLLETEVTSNRPDLLSHIGVAREISAIYSRKLKLPEHKIHFEKKISHPVKVKTISKNLCPFYSAMVLENIKWEKTPEWMTERLSVCGIRPINFLVDVTNYVLLETGQPLHAFDLDKIHGDVSARSALASEKLIAIDNNRYDLTPQDIVIADEKGPIALGGVMGGKETEVTSETKNILLEAALFSSAAVRKTSRRLKLVSESSYRFERTIDSEMIEFSRNRAAYLIATHSKVEKIGFPVSAGKCSSLKRSVSFNLNSIERILGILVPQSRVKSILNDLEIPTKGTSQKLNCSIPSFRSDITIEEDLVEEVARIHGYDAIPVTIPHIQPIKPSEESLIDFQEEARDICVGMGLSEVVTFSVINPAKTKSLNWLKNEWVTIANPRNSNLILMRPSMSASMLDAVRHNLNAGAKTISIFEVGRRYLDRGDALPFEERTVGFMLAGEKPASWLDKKREYTFYDVKGIMMRLIDSLRPVKIDLHTIPREMFEADQSFDLFHEGVWTGMLGAISNSYRADMDVAKPVYYGAISLTHLFSVPKEIAKYHEISKFPHAERDVALLVDEKITAGDLTQSIFSFGTGLIRKIELFDLYRGGKLPKGKKSMAFHIYYQSEERTLETEEVNQLHFSILSELNKQFKAELPPKI